MVDICACCIYYNIQKEKILNAFSQEYKQISMK